MANGVIGKVTAGGGTHLVTSTFYGTCATAANTAAKIVKLADATPDSATLITGMLLAVRFTNANSVANPTLTVQRNANTTNLIAAKPIIVHGSTAAGTTIGTSWRAGAVILFVYDGTNWVITDYNDYSIHQNAAITTAGDFNLLGGLSANANEETGSVNKLSKLTYNPSTNQLDLTGATPKIQLHRASGTAVTGTIQSETDYGITLNGVASATGAPVNITGTVGSTGIAYNSRTIKPILRINGIAYSTSNIETAGCFMNNTGGGNNTGYYTYGNGTQYGRMFINTIGKAGTATTYTNPDDETQTVTGYTGNTTGLTILELGNSKAVGTNGTGYSSPGTAGNANNARGCLRIYGANANYTDVYAQANGNRTLYLPNYNNTMYLVHAGNNNAIGTATKPVYVAANGRVTEGTAYAGGTAVTLNNASKAGSTATIYAPTAGGTAGQYLKAAGATSAPAWASFTKPTVAWTGGTTAGPTLKVTTDGGASDAVAIPSASGTASGIITTGAQTLAGAKTLTGDLTISKSTSIANNYPATLNFTTIQTDNNKTTTAYIKVYDDADNQSYGTNMVIQSTGAVIVGGGESPSALYSALGKTYTGENLFLTADGSIYAEANANTIANRIGLQVDTAGALIPVKAEAGNNRAQNIGSESYRWNNLYLGSTIDVTANGTGGAEIKAGNNNGIVSILASTNRGLYDRTKSAWIIYNNTAGDHTYAPLWASKGSSSEAVYFNTSGEPVTIATADLKAGKDGDGNTITSTYATKTEMNGIVAAADAMVFKGTLAGAATTTYTPAASRGDTYKVSTAGLINGERVEVGDILICTTDSTAAATSSNVSTVKANWAIVQNNVDGAVFKSTNTFTDGQVLVADGTNGKIKTSGYTIAKSVPSDAVFTDTVYTHPTTEGNKHIPSGGSSGQFLGWDSAGTAKWVANPNTDTKVNVVARGTTKAYLLADTTAPTSTAAAHTAVAETAVYLDTTAGKLVATSFAGNGSALTSLNGSNIASGTVPIARIPTGTTSSTVALGNHTHNYAGSSSAGGAATNATTTADTTNALYVVGVASGATTALKHDTNIIIQNNVMHPATNGTGSIGELDTRFQTLHLTNQITIKAHTATTMPSFMMQDENAKQYVGASTPVKGTTSVEGEGRVTLGNNVATGTAGNATGRLRMYGSDAQYGDIIYNGSTQSIDFIFA